MYTCSMYFRGSQLIFRTIFIFYFYVEFQLVLFISLLFIVHIYVNATVQYTGVIPTKIVSSKTIPLFIAYEQKSKYQHTLYFYHQFILYSIKPTAFIYCGFALQNFLNLDQNRGWNCQRAYRTVGISASSQSLIFYSQRDNSKINI